MRREDSFGNNVVIRAWCGQKGKAWVRTSGYEAGDRQRSALQPLRLRDAVRGHGRWRRLCSEGQRPSGSAELGQVSGVFRAGKN